MLKMMEKDLTERKSNLSAAKQALLMERLRGRPAGSSDPKKIPRRQQENYVPLSFAQQRLWLLDQLEPGNTAYNTSRLLSFSGVLNQDALRGALNAIVARHESLRTSFAVREG